MKLETRNIALHPDGRTLAYADGGYDNPLAKTIHVYDMETGENKLEIRHDNDVYSLVWLADGRLLAAGCTDTNEIRIWDVSVRPPRVVHQFTRQKGGGPNLSTNRTGDLLASSSGWAGGVRLWHPRTGQELLHFPGPYLRFPYQAKDGRLWGYIDREGSKSLWETVPPRGYLTWTRSPEFNPPQFRNLTISPDGRLIAAGVTEGVAFWDVASGAERGFLSLGGMGAPWFEPCSGDLFINCSLGLFRCPIHWVGANRVRVGPAEVWNKSGHYDCGISGNFDGSLIAVSGWPEGEYSYARQKGPPPRTLRYGPHADVRQIAVSPDGRWVATSRHDSSGVKIWDAASEKMIHELPSAANSSVGFTGDSRWLLSVLKGSAGQNNSCQLCEVGTWQPRWPRTAPGGAPAIISPDNQMVVSTEPDGRLCLVAASTGRTLARLEDPNQDRSTFLIFSPDGGKIIAASNDSQVLHIWDLRLIRQELSARVSTGTARRCRPPCRHLHPKCGKSSSPASRNSLPSCNCGARFDADKELRGDDPSDRVALRAPTGGIASRLGGTGLGHQHLALGKFPHEPIHAFAHEPHTHLVGDGDWYRRRIVLARGSAILGAEQRQLLRRSPAGFQGARGEGLDVVEFSSLAVGNGLPVGSVLAVAVGGDGVGHAIRRISHLGILTSAHMVRLWAVSGGRRKRMGLVTNR